MAKIALHIDHRKMPVLTGVTLKFSNGKTVRFPNEEAKIDKVDLMQWLGPEKPTLVIDLRLTFSASDVGVELEAIDGR